MNKEEFIAYCKTRLNWDFREIINDKRITWNQSKLEIALSLQTPFDYYYAIEDFNDD